MRLSLVIIVFFVSAFAKAQTFEIGIWAGGSNIIGDVGSTAYINPTGTTVGGIFKWNRSSRHSFRGTLLYSKITADDADSDDRSRELRGLEFDYNMLEASIGIEYTFWEWNLYNYKRQFVPYMYSGISAYRYDQQRLNNNAELEIYSNSIDVALPFILGVKGTLSDHLIIGAEIGARYTITDNLDGSNPEGRFGSNQPQRFGNLNNNDWYVFSGVTLTYTFGRKPCYCNF
ncbi:type IX secretion system protein PorG [Nonlabens ponticola]|uniref:DUF6089 domain-containing protein n=1 Tax=Nonlabens ponticola TaxID=2496866 RepID=A0A3S9MUY7_9FLAO|nr:DUF6089 family protein [Nonlabens ponticola]AZQ42996.1 hypothetical protein EJ995_01630 [Nonlabens ponticola]